jgi:hypothetical protein
MSSGIESSRGRARFGVLLAGVLATALSVGIPGSGGAQETAAHKLSVPEVTLYPAQLERGAKTPLLHIEEEVIVDGDLRVPVRGPAHVWLMGRIGRGYLITTAGPNFRRYTVQLVRRDGARRVLQRFGDRTMATMSANGRHLALTTMARPGTEIRVVRTRTGELVLARTFGSSGVEVSDYGQRRLVITGLRGGTYWWNPVRNRLRLIVPRPAKADIAVDRLVFLLPHPDRPYRDCQKTVRLSRPTEVLWRSCRNIPLNFSPDARRMLTVDIRADGIGPGTIQVRTARGRLVQTYRAPMWFGFTEWESDTDLLLQPVGRKYLAAVRCTLGDGCERASRLYRSPGTYDPPETMRWSFPQ